MHYGIFYIRCNTDNLYKVIGERFEEFVTRPLKKKSTINGDRKACYFFSCILCFSYYTLNYFVFLIVLNTCIFAINGDYSRQGVGCHKFKTYTGGPQSKSRRRCTKNERRLTDLR